MNDNCEICYNSIVIIMDNGIAISLLLPLMIDPIFSYLQNLIIQQAKKLYSDMTLCHMTSCHMTSCHMTHDYCQVICHSLCVNFLHICFQDHISCSFVVQF